MGSTLGRIFRITTWGESHGPTIGVVIDGCPSGVPISVEDIREELKRDIPDPKVGTPRREQNEPEILSGVFEGKTIGTPIAIMVRNTGPRSSHYSPYRYTPRPGHADFTYRMRYEHVDWRGGGRSSGRVAISYLMAGSVAKQILRACKIDVSSKVTEMAGVPITDQKSYQRAQRRVIEIGKQGDSTGGVANIYISNVPAGIGAPVFDGLEATLAHALMSIGGVGAFEVGIGKGHATKVGSTSNDPFTIEDGKVKTLTNNCGGILGGISNSMDIVMSIVVKPTPSIYKPQQTVDLKEMKPTMITLKGRFDINFTPRAAVLAESMAAITIVDHLIESGFVHPTRFSESPLLKERQ